jgi:tetratricopeptide (TPR) repeat protein
VLEEKTPLSRSLLWQLQRAYFDSRGVRAWNEAVVPHYITSNPWVAESYAAVVLGWLRDAAPFIDRTAPVPIVELGCGNGRFGYHFVRALLRLLDSGVLPGVRVRYVYTDFTEYNLDVLRSHPSLQPYVDAGVIAFARFDAESSRELPEAAGNPVAVIANYVLDGIPMDIFRAQNGRVVELLTRISAPADASPDEAARLKNISVTFRRGRAVRRRYADPTWNAILDSYRAIDGATIVFPCAALTLLRNLHELANGRLLLLSGDKGFTGLPEPDTMDEVHIALHGSVSLPVNYHALGAWTTARGGVFLRTTESSSPLPVVACLFDPENSAFAETRLAFAQHIERRGPADFFSVKRGVEQQYDTFAFDDLVAYLRFTGWDHAVFLGAFQALLRHAEDGSPATRRALREIARNVGGEAFPLREPDDLHFRLGTLMMAARDGEEALSWFARSLELRGPDPTTFLNMALCHGLLAQWREARSCARQALALAPELESAKELLAKLTRRPRHG